MSRDVARLFFGNDGPSTVLGAQALVEVPSGWTVQSATINLPESLGRCDVTAQTATCTIDAFGPTDDREVRVTAVPSVVAAGQVLEASILSSVPDPDGPAEATTAVDVISPVVDLGVSVSETPSPW